MRVSSIFHLLWLFLIGLNVCQPFRNRGFFQISRGTKTRFGSSRLYESSKDLILGRHRTKTAESRCILDGKTGKMLFSNNVELQNGIQTIPSLEMDLQKISCSQSDIRFVCDNCNSFSEYEKLLPNSSPHFIRASTHLSGALSVIDERMKGKTVIVMMNEPGDSYGEMMNDFRTPSITSFTDFHLTKSAENIQISEKNLKPGFSYREGESAYLFDSDQQVLKPLRKTWIEEGSSLLSKLDGSMESAYEFVTSLICDGNDVLLSNELSLLNISAVGNLTDLLSFQALPPAAQILLNKQFSTVDNTNSVGQSDMLFSGKLFLENGKINREFVSTLIQQRKSREFSIHEKIKLLQAIQENFLQTSFEIFFQLRETNDVGTHLILCSEFYHTHPQLFYRLQLLNNKIKYFEDIKLIDVDHANIAKVHAALTYQAYKEGRIPEDKQSFLLQAASNKLQQEGPCHDFSNNTLASLLKLYEPYLDIKLMRSDLEFYNSIAEDMNNGRLVGTYGLVDQSEVAKGSIFFHPGRLSFNLEKIKKLLSVYLHANRSFLLPISIFSEHVCKWFECSNDQQLESKSFELLLKMNSTLIKDLPFLSKASVFQHFPVQIVSEAQNSSFMFQLLSRFQKKTGLPLLIQFPLPKPLPDSSTRALTKPLDNFRNVLNYFLAMRGSIDSFYLNGKYKITLKEFPIDVINTKFVVSEPSMKEEDLLISGKKLLKTQMTYAANDSPDEIHIQDTDMTSDLTRQEEWRRLPSELHLEILQILQEIPDFSSLVVNNERLQHDLKEDSKTRDNSMTNPMTIGTLWNYLKEMHNAENSPAFEEESSSSDDEDEDDEEDRNSLDQVERLRQKQKKIELEYTNEKYKKTSDWTELKKALEWLYFEGLIQIKKNEDAPNSELQYSKFTIPPPKPPPPEPEVEPPPRTKDGFLDLENTLYDPELLELRKKFSDAQTIDLSKIDWEKHKKNNNNDNSNNNDSKSS